MGNSCCNERGDRDGEVLKDTQKKEDFSIKPTDTNNKPIHSSNATFSDAVDFKEPSGYFELNQNVLKAIENHGFFSPNTKNVGLPCIKSEGKSDDGRPYKYFGQMKDNLKSGKGQLQFMDKGGEFLVSSFENDKPVGESVVYFSNGDFFKGKIADGSMKEGTLFLNNGNRYEGPFVNNMYEGQGILVFADKRKYRGAFRKGQKEGFGVIHWANGSSYEGLWQNGHQHGHGSYVDQKGVLHEGEFFEGKLLKNA